MSASGAEMPLKATHIQVAGEAGVFLDVVEAQLGAAAHQGFDQAGGAGTAFVGGLDRGGVGGFRQFYPQQRAVGRVHRGGLEVAGRHFAEALEAADLHLAAAIEGGGEEFFAVGVVAGVEGRLALDQAVERRQQA